LDIKKYLTPHRMLVIIGLFSIGCLHAVIFGFLQYPENFLTRTISSFFQKILLFSLYFTAIFVACISQFISRKWGLKRPFIYGLWAYLFGVIIFYFAHTFVRNIYLSDTLLILGMILLGFAFSAVFVALTTYITLEFLEHTAMGITILFAFMNLGAMLSPMLLNVFNSWNIGWLFALILCVLMLISIRFVKVNFFDPKFPKHLQHLRKSSILWKEMHLRLGFYVLAIIFYGLVENTFNLFGEQYLSFYLTKTQAYTITSIFWLFLIIGQIFVLIGLYFTTPKKVFLTLVGLIILSFILLPQQKFFSGSAIILALAGIGCSACFPIILAILEVELKDIFKSEKHKSLLPYLEISTALMIAGYIAGTGFIAFLIEFFSKITLKLSVVSLYSGVFYCLIFASITLFLMFSFKKKLS
jgi:MFS family permease